MSIWVACKLPHGLTITHNGVTINLNGPNADHDPLAPVALGKYIDGENTSYGFGLTELSGAAQTAFEEWSNLATYMADGTTKLQEPFIPLQNGSIETYKTEREARQECKQISAMVVTGLEGLDAEKELKTAAQGTNLTDTGTATKG